MMSFNFKRALSVAALATSITLSSCQKEDLMEDQFNQQETSSLAGMHGQPIPGQYIVVMKKDGANVSTSRVGEMSSVQRESVRSIRKGLLTDLKVEASSVKEVYEGTVNGFAAKLTDDQLAKLKNNPAVAYVEQDRIISLGKPTTRTGGKKTTTSPTPTEPTPVVTEPTPVVTEPTPTTGSTTAITPVTGELVPWNIARVGYGNGTGKTAWIIDSGIDTDHPDLNIDLARSTSFIYGVSSVEDVYGHGTIVAGIIGAKNNGTGMIGVASGATIVALRVFDDAGSGTMSRAISAVNHVINVASAGDVVNMSLGGGISSTLDNAVLSAASKGIMFAIASGNSAVDCINNSPARVNGTNIYTVSAMDKYDRFATFSNYGTPVDFAAPGVDVTSTANTGSLTYYATGTSFAAPHVAGILLLQGKVNSNGTVAGDADANPDAIAVL